jgi:sugar lactone lactonase YvrE
MICFLLNAAVWTAVDAQQYTISTYAGGAPAPPMAAIALAVDAQKNVYFVDGYGFNGLLARSNSVFKIDPSGSITRIAGNSRTGFSGDGGPAASASLYSPLGVAVDNAGNVFIVDAGNQRVRRVALDGTIATVAGGGSAVLGDNGPALLGQLNYPNSIAIDGAGNLFIGEYGRVRKVTPGGIINTVAGGGPNDPGDGGPATSAALSSVVSVAVDGAGDLFLGEQVYDPDIDDLVSRIRKVSSNGNISTLPPVPLCCNGSMAADTAGNLFVPAGPAIWKISPDGSKSVVAGTGSYGPSSGDGGAATSAQLNGPHALAVNPAGELLIADDFGRSLRQVSADGIIRTLASIQSSAPPASGDGGLAVNAQLQLAVQGISSQSGLAADSAGNLYIAETGAYRVRKVSPEGTITTVAGLGVPPCSGNPSTCLPLGDGGPALSAALSFPTSVALDGAGNLFIADGARVRKVSRDGTIVTVAGNGYSPKYPPQRGLGDGGLATETSVIPFGIAVDDAGNLYFSEGSHGDVRKVFPDGTITTVLSPPTAAPYSGFISAATVDRVGNLFVAGSACDTGGPCYNAIRRIASSGSVTILVDGRYAALTPGAGLGDGGPAINAAIGFVSTLVVDTAGNLFFADLYAQRIRKIDLNGIITTVGGNGVPGYFGDGGPATNATLNYPFGLASDAADNIYVSDFNQAVRILRPSHP